MPDYKKPQTQTDTNDRPTRIPDIAMPDTGTGKREPPGEIEGIEYKQPPPKKYDGVATQTAGSAKKPPKLTAGLSPEKQIFKTPHGWLSFEETLKYYPDIINQYETGNLQTGSVKPVLSYVEQGSKEAQELAQKESFDYTTKPMVKPESRLAQTTRTQTRSQWERPKQKIDEYDDYFKQRIKNYDYLIQQNPDQAKNLRQLQSGVVAEAKDTNSKKDGEVPKESLPTVKKMIGEYKDYYYKGYADIIARAKEQGRLYAPGIESAQVQAMRYGLSSLTNLHHGLNEATWNFFFTLMGPIGDSLSHLKNEKISLTMKYYNSLLNPQFIDFWMQTVPNEKLFDLVYGGAKRGIYYIAKITGPLNPVSKVTYFDEYGRRRSSQYTLAPLMYTQKNISAIAGFLDRLTMEGTRFQIDSAYNDLVKTMGTITDPIKLKILEKDFKLKTDELSILNRSLDRNILPTNIDSLIARTARTLGLRSLAKNLRKTHRDVLSYFTILIAGWIIDITFGNLSRIIMEKLATAPFWQKLTGTVENFVNRPFFKNFGLGLETTKAFVTALPSLNTLSGGYLGYNLGGVIGQNVAKILGLDPTIGFNIGTTVGLPIGGGLGWGYQWALNLSNTQSLLDFTRNYTSLTNKLYDLHAQHWQMYKKWGAGSPSVNKINEEIAKYESELEKLPRGKFAPGPMLRLANWLNPPEGASFSKALGRFFRIPIKGFALSQLLSPFEAQIQTYFPLYQGWMPPVAEYLWEIKGGIWDFGFKPTFGKMWDVAKFNYQGTDVRLGENANWSYLEREIMPGSGIFETAGSEYAIKMIGPNGEISFKLVTPRGWYKNFLDFQKTINTITGNSEYALNNQLVRWLQGNGFLPKLANKMINYIQDLSKVGLTNFAGFIIGWEIASILAPGVLLAPIIGGVVGFLGINPILTFSGRLLGHLGIITDGVLFATHFSAGFWLGTGIQMVAGFLGYQLPWFFPPAMGLAFSLLPTVLIIITPGVYAIFPALGTALASLTISMVAGGMASMFTVLSMLGIIGVTVGVFFIVIVVGSAFWMPISEELAGLKPQSLCFDISTPLINGKQEAAVFHNGEQKQVCWTTTTADNLNLYQGDIVKSKTFSPYDKFEVKSFNISLQSTNGNAEWKNVEGASGNYKLSKTPNRITETINSGPPLNIPFSQQVENGINFNITPPKDVGKQECIKEQTQALTEIDSNPHTPDEILANQSAQSLNADIKSELIYNNLLNYISHPNDRQTILNDINSLDMNTVFNNKILSPPKIITFNVVAICLDLEKNPSANTAAVDQAVCPSVLTDLKADADATSIKNQFNSLLTEYNNATPQRKTELENSYRQQQSSASQFRNYVATRADLVKKVKDLPKTQDTTQHEKDLNGLAGGLCPTEQNFLPAGSTITTCLDVLYKGNNDEAGMISEKDSTTLPIAGPIATNVCQAELAIPVNNGPNDKIQWPTNNPRVISDNGDYRYNYNNPGDPQNHTGIDIPGTNGDKVTAAADGIIIDTGYESNGFGYYIIEKSGNGYFIYGHLGERLDNKEYMAYAPNITKGTSVKAGDLVGYMGSSGKATGTHLHLGWSSGLIPSDIPTKSFWNNSNTTADPCMFMAGECPAH